MRHLTVGICSLKYTDLGRKKLNLATHERAQNNFWTKTLRLNNKMCVIM